MALANAVRNVLGVDAGADGLSVHLPHVGLLSRLAELRKVCQDNAGAFLPDEGLEEHLA